MLFRSLPGSPQPPPAAAAGGTPQESAAGRKRGLPLVGKVFAGVKRSNTVDGAPLKKDEEGQEAGPGEKDGPDKGEDAAKE